MLQKFLLEIIPDYGLHVLNRTIRQHRLLRRWWRGVEVQPPEMVGYYDLDAEIVVSNHDLDAEIVVVIRQNGEAAIAIAQAQVVDEELQ